MIKLKIKRFVSSDNPFGFPKNDMHMWLTAKAMTELGILDASMKCPQYIKIECKSPLNKFTIYGIVASLNDKVEYEEGYLWVPTEIIHKSIIFDKNTEVEVNAVNLEEFAISESVTVKLNEEDVENWSEDEVERAKRNYRLRNGISFMNQCVFIKPSTKNVVVGVIDSIFPRPETHTQLFRIGKDTKIFFDGLPVNQQKVIDFNQIGGLDVVIEKLREIIQIPITCPEHISRFGIKRPKGMLMYGPPGNGKTMVARAVAQSMGSSFISIEGPELMSKYVGVGEQRLREKFEEAETKGNCVIFIDEIDSIASVRSDSAAEYQVSIVATLLNLMDGMKNNNVFVIGATNRINAIDPALRRPGRFDIEFEIPLPSTAARLDILHKYIKLDKKYLFEGNVTEQTLKRLSELTNGYSGADLSLLYREAAMFAIRRNIVIDGRTGKLSETSTLDSTRIKESDFFEAMKHIVPTTLRNEDVNSNNTLWNELVGVDRIKDEFVKLHNQMNLFANSEGVLIRPSFANVVLSGPLGSGKHTLVHAFASEYGYETIDIDFLKLLSMDVTAAYIDIEKKFTKAQQVAPSILTISNISERFDYNHFLEKIIHEANTINKRSMVFVVLIFDGDDENVSKFIGYKRFGKSISINMPDESVVKELLKIYNMDEDDIALFKNKPIGQLIAMMSESFVKRKNSL